MKRWQKLIERLEELVDEEGYEIHEIALIYDEYANLEAVAFRRYHIHPETLEEVEKILEELGIGAKEYTLRGWDGYVEVYIPNNLGVLEEEVDEDGASA